MIELYNTSYMETSNNILDQMIGIGSVIGTEYLIGNMILVSFFLIVLIIGIRNAFLEVLIIDSFVTTIIAILLFSAGMIASPIIMFPAFIFTLTLIFYLMS